MDSGEQTQVANALPAGVTIAPAAGGKIRVAGALTRDHTAVLRDLGATPGLDANGKQRYTLPAADETRARAALAEPVPTPEPQAARMFPTVSDALKTVDKIVAERTRKSALHDAITNFAAPMLAGTPEARATAKDWANESRAIRFEHAQADKNLTTRFSHEQLEKMWRAADEQSVAEQQGKSTAGIGLDMLKPDERAVVEKLQNDARDVYEQAKAVGIISPEADGLPSYVPRMVVAMSKGGAELLRRRGAPESNGTANGPRTSSPNTRLRKYLTTDETENAAKGIDDNAEVVKNIRTLPLATSKLREAIAGRELINKIRDLGKQAGVETVAEGRAPRADASYFTMDHPAFTTWKPRMHEVNGKTVPMLRDDGSPVFDKVPLQVLGSFEGPLKAVLGEKSESVYNALMNLKARVTSTIMYSPVIHNMVEFGRALPAMPGKVITLRVYGDGARALADPETMREAIRAGLVPIGHGARSDITGIADSPNIKPGRSWTSQVLAYVPGLFDPKAGDAVKRFVDQAGDLWHNKLLWDVVARLQAGLYTNFRDGLVAKGLQPRAAQIMAAHAANRYSGALPKEAMSASAQKIANLVLFSRSFTFGNLGLMKDALTGLPKDAQAQILRDCGELQLTKAVSVAKRKALATVGLDIGLMIVSNSLLQSSLAIMSGDSSLDKEIQGYVRRWQSMMQRVRENPMELMGALGSLSATADNEPGRENRIKVGHAADGTAIYMRNPLGKVGEDLGGWIMAPLDTLKAKMSTFAKPLYQTLANDKGFGQKVYDPYDESAGANGRRMSKIVQLIIGDQLPMQAIEGAKDALTGKGGTLNVARVLAPLGGVTFSSGAPGGPALGELAHARDEHQYKVSEAMPGIRDEIRSGNIQGAVRDMTRLGIEPGLMRYYVQSTLDPRMRLSKTQMQAFGQYATPEERERMGANLQR